MKTITLIALIAIIVIASACKTEKPAVPKNILQLEVSGDPEAIIYIFANDQKYILYKEQRKMTIEVPAHEPISYQSRRGFGILNVIVNGGDLMFWKLSPYDRLIHPLNIE